MLLLACLAFALLPQAADAASPSRLFTQTGYSVADTPSARFLAEFQRLGGVEALGYPVSQPYTAGGFTYQAFQRAVLQWRPELGQAYLANSMDFFGAAGREASLRATGIPAPLTDSSAGSFARAVSERESWLTEPTIARVYRAGGGYSRFGLPSSHPQQAGPFVVQRFQRYVFQYWTSSVPGMPAKGSVVGVLVGDLLKQQGLVPASALVASDPAATSLQPPKALAQLAHANARPTGIPVVPYRGQYDGSSFQRSNCGPAALGMLLGYNGQSASTLDLRLDANRQMHTSNPTNGTSWPSLVYAARARGFEPTGLYAGASSAYRVWSTDELLGAGPTIALVRYRSLPGHEKSRYNGDHYIVVLGRDSAGNVVYHDSSPVGGGSGAYLLMSRAQLEAAWSHTSVGINHTALGLRRR